MGIGYWILAIGYWTTDFACSDIGPAAEALGIVEHQIALCLAWHDNHQAHLLGIIRAEQRRDVDIGEDVDVADQYR